MLNLLGKELKMRCYVVEKIWREGYDEGYGVSCQIVVFTMS